MKLCTPNLGQLQLVEEKVQELENIKFIIINDKKMKFDSNNPNPHSSRSLALTYFEKFDIANHD